MPFITASTAPENKTAYIFLSRVFDVKGERKQTEHREITNCTREEIYEIILHNHRQEATEVVVVDGKKDARTVELPLSLPGGGEITTVHTVCCSW